MYTNVSDVLGSLCTSLKTSMVEITIQYNAGRNQYCGRYRKWLLDRRMEDTEVTAFADFLQIQNIHYQLK